MQQEGVWPYWQSETNNGTILSEETSGLEIEKNAHHRLETLE